MTAPKLNEGEQADADTWCQDPKPGQCGAPATYRTPLGPRCEPCARLVAAKYTMALGIARALRDEPPLTVDQEIARWRVVLH